MTWAAAIPMLVQAGSSIAAAAMSDRDPYDETRLQEQVNALEASRIYEEAAINPASPHFKALQAIQEAEIKRNVMMAIDTLMRSQNRARARGVIGALVNPERRDESIAGMIGDMFAKSGDQARRGAQASLQGAAQSARGRAGGYGDINRLLAGYGDVNQMSRLAVPGAINEIFQSSEVKDALSKIFGGSSPMTWSSAGAALSKIFGGAAGAGAAPGSFRGAQQVGLSQGLSLADILSQKTQFVSGPE